ncbi:MAG: hypothetical protein Q7Q71_08490 [Verrucomicrobiota bacterium JB023]|nr:hypothetical protein [Verrucomicrobiota bacterium JB023]
MNRILTIATGTFTQLVRMKVFYFLALFVVLAIALNFFRLPHHIGPEAAGEQELRLWKSGTIGLMKLFAIVFSLAATALLLPRDVEDRTLYTILCKPVPRLDYLTGKLLGVLMLTFVALLVMDLLMSAVLHHRTNLVAAERLDLLQRQGFSEADIAIEMDRVHRHGVTASLQFGILGLFLEAAVLAAVALLISTFSTSTLFTILSTVLVYFIGFFMGEAKDYWLEATAIGDSFAGRAAIQLLSLVFPDLSLFGLADAAIEGTTIPALTALRVAGLALIYLVTYTLVSWFVFADKEF